MNIEFGISVDSKFLVPKGGPVIKPVKHFYGFGSRRGHFLCLQKSHPKKKSKTRQIFFYFHRKFEVDANENETSSEPGSFISTQSKTRQPASGEWVFYFIRADNFVPFDQSRIDVKI